MGHSLDDYERFAATLGIELDLDDADYRRLAREHHPDNGGDIESMKRLNALRDRTQERRRQASTEELSEVAWRLIEHLRKNFDAKRTIKTGSHN